MKGRNWIENVIAIEFVDEIPPGPISDSSDDEPRDHPTPQLPPERHIPDSQVPESQMRPSESVPQSSDFFIETLDLLKDALVKLNRQPGTLKALKTALDLEPDTSIQSGLAQPEPDMETRPRSGTDDLSPIAVHEPATGSREAPSWTSNPIFSQHTPPREFESGLHDIGETPSAISNISEEDASQPFFQNLAAALPSTTPSIISAQGSSPLKPVETPLPVPQGGDTLSYSATNVLSTISPFESVLKPSRSYSAQKLIEDSVASNRKTSPSKRVLFTKPIPEKASKSLGTSTWVQDLLHETSALHDSFVTSGSEGFWPSMSVASLGNPPRPYRAFSPVKDPVGDMSKLSASQLLDYPKRVTHWAEQSRQTLNESFQSETLKFPSELRSSKGVSFGPESRAVFDRSRSRDRPRDQLSRSRADEKVQKKKFSKSLVTLYDRLIPYQRSEGIGIIN